MAASEQELQDTLRTAHEREREKDAQIVDQKRAVSKGHAVIQETRLELQQERARCVCKRCNRPHRARAAVRHVHSAARILLRHQQTRNDLEVVQEKLTTMERDKEDLERSLTRARECEAKNIEHTEAVAVQTRELEACIAEKQVCNEDKKVGSQAWRLLVSLFLCCLQRFSLFFSFFSPKGFQRLWMQTHLRQHLSCEMARPHFHGDHQSKVPARLLRSQRFVSSSHFVCRCIHSLAPSSYVVQEPRNAPLSKAELLQSPAAHLLPPWIH